MKYIINNMVCIDDFSMDSQKLSSRDGFKRRTGR
jgi:hypothetical protein